MHEAEVTFCTFHLKLKWAESQTSLLPVRTLVHRNSNKADMLGRQPLSYHSSLFVCMENKISHTHALVFCINKPHPDTDVLNAQDIFGGQMVLW